jgi:hypothetical protein
LDEFFAGGAQAFKEPRHLVAAIRAVSIKAIGLGSSFLYRMGMSVMAGFCEEKACMLTIVEIEAEIITQSR